jgi:hypothetical protein
VERPEDELDAERLEVGVVGDAHAAAIDGGADGATALGVQARAGTPRQGNRLDRRRRRVRGG